MKCFPVKYSKSMFLSIPWTWFLRKNTCFSRFVHGFLNSITVKVANRLNGRKQHLQAGRMLFSRKKPSSTWFFREKMYSNIYSFFDGRLVQLVRTHPSHGWGREFESPSDHHLILPRYFGQSHWDKIHNTASFYPQNMGVGALRQNKSPPVMHPICQGQHYGKAGKKFVSAV